MPDAAWGHRTAGPHGLSRRRFLGYAGATGTAGVLAPGLLEAIDGPGASAATPVPGGTLNWRESAEPTTLDPAASLGGSTTTSYGQEPLAIYDTLVIFNVAKSNFVFRTATSITPNSGQTVWTIKLHPGITFTDGTPYDANAINFHWNRIKNPATASALAAVISGWTWTVVDPQTFQVTLPNPLGNFIESMAGGLGAIPSPTAVTKYGNLYGTSPSTTVGAGPFMVSSWVHSTAITMTKNPNYWQSGKPYLNTIIFTNTPDNPTALNGMLTNQFQMSFFPTADQTTLALEQAGFPASKNEYVTAYGIQFQFAQTPYNDVRVRQALVLAINPVDANLKSTAGAAVVAGGKGTAFYPKISPFYDATVNQKMNNLAAAQKLLNSYIAEKGAISGSQPLTCPTNTFLVNLGTALQQQWAKLTGITIQLSVTATSAAAILAYSKGQYGVAISAEPAWLYVQDAYAGLYSTSPANLQHYNNPKMDALITAGRGYQDIAHRKSYLNQMGQLVINDALYGRIYFEVFYNFAQKNVGNLSTANNGGPPMWPDPTLLYLAS
jgi:peptide/nickel transport system substrate-binding protein